MLTTFCTDIAMFRFPHLPLWLRTLGSQRMHKRGTFSPITPKTLLLYHAAECEPCWLLGTHQFMMLA